MSKLDIVKAFQAAWAEGDVEGALKHCTDDIVWDNVPMKPFHGKLAVQAFLEKFARGMSNPHYEITHALEEGDLLLEGVENYEKNGRSVSVPYMASFLFRGDQIYLWRDYFDLATVERQVGMTTGKGSTAG